MDVDLNTPVALTCGRHHKPIITGEPWLCEECLRVGGPASREWDADRTDFVGWIAAVVIVAALLVIVPLTGLAALVQRGVWSLTPTGRRKLAAQREAYRAATAGARSHQLARH